MRRALVVLLALLLAGGTGAWFLRGDDGDDGNTDGGVRTWDRMVVQDPVDGFVTVTDRDGEVLSTVETGLAGLLDVGLDGRVVVGTAGTPSTDGIGVLSLEEDTKEATDTIEVLDVDFDAVRRLGTSSFLIAYDPLGTGLQLVDVEAARVTDLLALAESDAPFVTPDQVQIDPGHTHVAFTDFRGSVTLVVDTTAGATAGATAGTTADTTADTTAGGMAVSLPGSLADIAFGRALTMTNRGDSALLDLSDFDGTRVGTVEVPLPVATMLVDDHTVITVTAAGVVSRVDFTDESIDAVADIGPQLPLPPGADETTPLVAQGFVVANHTRLVLLGERFVALVDEEGALVKSIDVAAQGTPLFGSDIDDRCVVVGPAVDGPVTFIDTEVGGIITSFTDGQVVGRSHDGCVVAVTRQEADLVTGIVVGIDVNQSTDLTLLALSDDGTAALGNAARATSVVDVAPGAVGRADTRKVVAFRAVGVFAHS